jgi:hypothetical protein
MRFMLIAKATKDSEAGLPRTQDSSQRSKLSEDMAKAGVLVDAGGLYPSATGARIRLSGGKVTVTDGPFAEARELIGGYAIVETKSKTEAIELSERFWKLHADVMGPNYEGEGEIRQLHDPADFARA